MFCVQGTHLWAVEPWNTNPAIAKGEIIYNNGAHSNPLRGGSRVRQADHGDENDHADGQNGRRPYQDIPATEALDRKWEWERPGREPGVHHCG